MQAARGKLRAIRHWPKVQLKNIPGPRHNRGTSEPSFTFGPWRLLPFRYGLFRLVCLPANDQSHTLSDS
jgi:hypothetical protein